MEPPGGTPLVAVGGFEAGKTRSVIFFFFFSDSFFLWSDLRSQKRESLRKRETVQSFCGILIIALNFNVLVLLLILELFIYCFFFNTTNLFFSVFSFYLDFCECS